VVCDPNPHLFIIRLKEIKMVTCRKKTPRKKIVVAPKVKTQETFESRVKEELQSVSGNISTTKMKRKRNKDTSLLDDPQPKKKAKPKAPVPKRIHHTENISELNNIKFADSKFAQYKYNKTLESGASNTYIASILYRNMLEFLKREKFYLTSIVKD